MRSPDADYPLSYLHAEYADRCNQAGRVPLALTPWALDPAHPPSFAERADVQALRAP